jgi:hypothetical protein
MAAMSGEKELVMRIKYLLLVAAVLGLMACSWVNLTPAGREIRIVNQQDVKSCKKIGKTMVTVADKVMGMKRKESAIEVNLEVLARNAAADMKGDTIVPVTPIQNGKRTYAVYRCMGP